MVKLLMIADDFTGALDTGIQFVKKGIKTQVFTEQIIEEKDIKADVEVLVVDTESRPMNAQEAGRVVGRLTKWAVNHGIQMVFKKTDSALRGNIGAELEAASAAAGRTLYFLPAYPEIGRITKEGIHYIDGELLENSVFGMDPFEPVTQSYIPDIIREQSSIPVKCIGTEEGISQEDAPGITVCDAVSEEDIDRRVDELIQEGKTGLVAGCAALACRFAEKLSFRHFEAKEFYQTKQLFVACGSLNRITEEQVDYAEQQGGFLRLHLTMEQKLLKGYFETEKGKNFLKEIVFLCRQSRKMIVDTFDTTETKKAFLQDHQIQEDQVRGLIAGAHGRIVKEIMEKEPDVTVLLTGGDTLMGYMKLIGCKQLEPVCEIEPGVVVSSLELDGRSRQVISKSGGFGERDILCRIARKILKMEKGGLNTDEKHRVKRDYYSDFNSNERRREYQYR